jgi:transaldolase
MGILGVIRMETTNTIPNPATSFRVKLFADGADLDGMREMARNPMISGLTTNPTLMRKAGITNYRDFAHTVLEAIPNLPISFEVFADEFEEMERHAMQISSWGPNVFVKIPVTNTKGESSAALIARLNAAGVKLNVTAVMTLPQVQAMIPSLQSGVPAYISVFAGRIADAGVDPVPVMRSIVDTLGPYPQIELIWASPREVLNIIQADRIGCHVITLTHDLIRKIPSLGKDLDEFSLETVQMFRRDAIDAAYTL